ncbi:hypothetical protein JHS3_07150 [Jeongeupia sp. HS-3]|uniref:protein YgfX n=1 Tax=Jeongeupia sp. HS-3 TaxID=1009682 RepID=UPI0018A44ABA|nr:protein YgfX [Jeongeupia sp. HS-3]BCL74979.1 hypothetical protein JHS3_07150 [Jeongeupia sp. HS-3]
MTPLPLRLVRSRQQRCLHAVAGFAAAAAAIAAPWPWGAFGLVWLIAAAWMTQRRVLPLGIDGCDDGTVLLRWPDGSASPAAIAPASRVGVWLIALQFVSERGRCALVLWPDSADSETLRQWRIWLRWERPAVLRRIERRLGEAPQPS